MSVSEGLRPAARVSSTKIVLSGIALVLMMGSLSGSIVSTALPQIAQSLQGVDYLTWVVTAYLLSSTCSAPISGRIGDIYGRRAVLMVAIGLFLMGSIFAALALNMYLLVAARFVQGLGGGAMMVLSQTVIAEVVPPNERGKIQGYMGIVFTASAIGGPFVGGLLVGGLSWQWVFLINLPLAAFAMIIVARFVPANSHKKPIAVDYLGASILAGALSLLVVLTSLLGSTGLSVSAFVGFAVAFVLLAVLFVLVERKAVSPILPLALFSIRNFSAVNANSFLVGAAMYAEIIFLPVYLQIVRGGSALETGYLMLPMMLGMMATSTGSGFLMTHTGHYRRLFIAGGVAMVVGFYGLTHLTPDTDILVAVALMVVVGIGLGPIMSLTIPTIQNSVPAGDLGVATASVSMFRQIGGSVGASVFGMIFAAALSGVMGETVRSGAQAVTAAEIEAMTEVAASAYRSSVNGAIQSVFHVAWMVSALALLSSFLMVQERVSGVKRL